jgi:dedicator of cytokinesis protein 3
MAGKHNERVVEHALPVGKGATAPGGRRKSSDLSRTLSSKENSDPNAAGGERKVGNVRKRLSMLKLGKKSSKGSGLMGSLDEE